MSAAGLTPDEDFRPSRRGPVGLLADPDQSGSLVRTGRPLRSPAMETRALTVPDAFEFRPRTFPDDRGMFAAPYQEALFSKAVGHPLTLAQTNHSISRRGTIRGLHFADVPPGQAKYVYCPRGRLLDIVVDLRVGSPAFGQWDVVELDDTALNAIYVPEGLGHAFVAL